MEWVNLLFFFIKKAAPYLDSGLRVEEAVHHVLVPGNASLKKKRLKFFN